MISCSQQWRQQIAQHTTGWSRTAVLSAVVRTIAEKNNIVLSSLYRRHPWLKDTRKLPFDLSPPIAALGWAHQYLNDPKRHAIDQQIQRTRKVESSQLAQKTQIFTPQRRAQRMANLAIGAFWQNQGEQTPFRLEYPLPIIESINKRTTPSQISILDPACGSGILLLEAAQTLHTLWRHWSKTLGLEFNSQSAMKHILRYQIHGCDIDPHMTELSQISLSILALKHGVEPEEYQLYTFETEQWGALTQPPPINYLDEQQHHIVLTNPPYQNIRRISDAKTLKNWYPHSHTDLYSAFMERCVFWLKPDGISCALTMHNWLFLRQLENFRRHMLSIADLRLVEQHNSSAFDGLQGEVTQSCLSLWRKGKPNEAPALGVDKEGNHHWFQPHKMKCLPNHKLLFWFSSKELEKYKSIAKLGDIAPACQGLATGNNVRFLRYIWEVDPSDIGRYPTDDCMWLPYTKGAAGRAWFTPLETVIYWAHNGWHKQQYSSRFGSKGGNGLPNRQYYGQSGIAYAKIGHRFTAREIQRPGIIGNAGSAIFPPAHKMSTFLCLLNHPQSKAFLNRINPSVNFTETDINSLPIIDIPYADIVYETLKSEYHRFERGQESAVRFQHPQPQRWLAAQEWATKVLSTGKLSPLNAEDIPPLQSDWHSYALGVAIGRFPHSDHPNPLKTLVVLKDALPDDLDLATHQVIIECARTNKSTFKQYLFSKFFKDHLKKHHHCPPIWPLGPKDQSFMILINGRLAAMEDIQQAILRCRHYSLTQDGHNFLTQLEELLKNGPPSQPEAQIESPHPYKLCPTDGLLCQASRLWPAFAFGWNAPKERWLLMGRIKGRLSFAWSQTFRDFYPSRFTQQLSDDPSILAAPPDINASSIVGH